MIVRFVMASMVLLVGGFCVGDDKKDGKKEDKDLLQGEWMVVSTEIAGKKTENRKDKKLVVKGDEWTLPSGSTLKFKIDATKNPKQLDLTFKKGEKESAWAGIYKIEGETLTFCRSFVPGGERPTEFNADKGALIVYKRAAVLPGGDAKADLDKFQGTWDVTGYERNGEKFPVMAITFTGDKMKRYAAAGDPSPSRPEWAIKLDPSKKPRAIDVTVLTGPNKGKTRLGIFQLEGDELKLCLARPDVKERPAEFKSTEGSPLVVITLKRSKK